MLNAVNRGLLAAGVVCAFAVPACAAAGTYSFQTLELSSQVGSQVWGINNAGVVVGDALDGTPFVYQAGVYSTPAGLPGALSTLVFGVTASGAILGNSVMSEVRDDQGQVISQQVTPFVSSGGTFYSLAGLPAASFYQARGISANGRYVAGIYSVGEDAPLGFGVDRTTGQVLTLNVPSTVGGTILLHGVSDSGLALGDWTYVLPSGGGVLRESVLWDLSSNSVSNFALAGYSKTAARGINAQGTIAGWVRESSGRQHGFLRGVGGVQIIDMPGATSTQIEGLNDRGQLIGMYLDANGLSHGFLATPVPEPTTAGMMLAGLLGLLGFQRCRKASASA